MKHLLSALLILSALVSQAQTFYSSDAMNAEVAKARAKADSAKALSAANTVALTSLTSVGIQTHTTGASFTLANTTKRGRVDPAAVLPALNIILPTGAVDGQRVQLQFGGTITNGPVVSSLTITGTVLDTEPPAGEVLAGEIYAWEYRASDSKYIRLRSEQLGRRLKDMGITAPPATATTIYSLSTSMFIFHHTDFTQPGDLVDIQGSFPATVKVRANVVGKTASIELPVVSQSLNFVKVRLPASVQMNAYEVYVVDAAGTAKSASKFMSRAHPYSTDSGVIFNGCDLKIAGKNLLFTGGKPVVRFESTGNATLYGSVIQGNSDWDLLSIKAPTGLVTSAVYDVYVSNGFGAAAGFVKVPTSVTALAEVTDDLDLRLGWSALFTAAMKSNTYNIKTDSRLGSNTAVGNNTANDNGAVNNAIFVASNANGATGGTIVFPDGTYKLDNLELRAKVILRGTGRDKCKLNFALDFNEPGISMFYLPAGRNAVGIEGFTIDYTGPKPQNFVNAYLLSDYVYFKNCHFTQTALQGLYAVGVKHFALINCTFDKTPDSQVQGPVRLEKAKYVTIRDCSSRHEHGWVILNSEFVYVLDTKFTLDYNREIAGTVNHDLIVDFVNHSIFKNISFRSIGTIPTDIGGQASNLGIYRGNWRERFISEGGASDPPGVDRGTIASATATSITATALGLGWTAGGPTNGLQTRHVLAIIRGKGAGQERFITGVSGNVLTVSTPFDVTPDNTSVYATFVWSLDHVILSNFSFENSQRALTLYHGSYNKLTIVGPKLNNGGSIDFTSIQSIRPDGRKLFNVLRDIDILRAEVNSRADKYQDSEVGFKCIKSVQGETYGAQLINGRIKDLTFNISPTNRPVAQDKFWFPSVGAFAFFEPAGEAYADGNNPVLLGVIVDNVTAYNVNSSITYKEWVQISGTWQQTANITVPHGIVKINSGTHHASITGVTAINSPNVIDDQTISGAGHASVNTTYIP